MLGLGPDRKILRDRVQCRLCIAGAHAARSRYSRGLRPAQERDREALGARAHGIACDGDDGLGLDLSTSRRREADFCLNFQSLALTISGRERILRNRLTANEFLLQAVGIRLMLPDRGFAQDARQWFDPILKS